MTVLHTGSTKKFSTNWESIFQHGAKKTAVSKKTTAKSSSAATRKGAKSAKKKTKK